MDNYQKQRGVNSPGMQRLHQRTDFESTADGGSELDNFHSPPSPASTPRKCGAPCSHFGGQHRQLRGHRVPHRHREIIRKQGMLYVVGRSFVTLYDELANNFIVCDIYSVKFVYFYMPGDRPRYHYNTLPPISGEPGMGPQRPRG